MRYIKFNMALFCALLIIGLSSCAKETLVSKAIDCEFVSLEVLNSLDKKIEDLTINEEFYGDLDANTLSDAICFDDLVVDGFVDWPMVLITGRYDNEVVNGYFGFCGVGLMTVTEGEFKIEITQVENNTFYYSPK